MKKVRRYRNKGLTFIEVMLAVLVSVVIVIGALSYMYASAWHAKEADVRATAARIGLLLMEGWKANGVDTAAFDPATEFNRLPLSDFGDPGNLNALPGLTHLLQNRGYRIEANKVKFFVKMTYSDDTLKILSLCIAWNRDYSSTTLGTNPNTVVLSDYAIF